MRMTTERRYREALDRLERLRRHRKISDEAYLRVREEYRGKLAELPWSGRRQAVIVVIIIVFGLVTIMGFGFPNSPDTFERGIFLTGGTSPSLTLSITNSASGVNLTQVSISGPGINGVYTWTPDAAWQGANSISPGTTKWTIRSSTIPAFSPEGIAV